MDFKEKIDAVLKERKKAVEREFNIICEKITNIYSCWHSVANIKIFCNEETRELEFATVNYGVSSMKKDEWQLLYDLYFTQPNAEVNFYAALSKKIHDRLGLMTELIYSENDEIPKIIALRVSISDFLIKE